MSGRNAWTVVLTLVFMAVAAAPAGGGGKLTITPGLGAAGADAGPSARLFTPVAAPRCVGLRERIGGDTLVNACTECRVVKVSRRRPGSGPATQRTYTLVGASELPLSFRGPGQTRLLSEEACESPAAAAAEPRAQKCVGLQRLQTGLPALLNPCEACRLVVVERTRADGVRNLQTYALSPKTYLPLNSLGADQARILTEKSCR